MKRYIVVAVGAIVNSKSESNMFDKGKFGGSIRTTCLQLYFFKLHSRDCTLTPLIKRRNRGVTFFLIFRLFTIFPPLFLVKILGPGIH